MIRPEHFQPSGALSRLITNTACCLACPQPRLRCETLCLPLNESVSHGERPLRATACSAVAAAGTLTRRARAVARQAIEIEIRANMGLLSALSLPVGLLQLLAAGHRIVAVAQRLAASASAADGAI